MADESEDFRRGQHIGQAMLAESMYLRECGWVSRVHLKEHRVVWFPPGTDPKKADRVYDHAGAVNEQRARDTKLWQRQYDIAAELHPLGDREIKGNLPPTVSVL